MFNEITLRIKIKLKKNTKTFKGMQSLNNHSELGKLDNPSTLRKKHESHSFTGNTTWRLVVSGKIDDVQ